MFCHVRKAPNQAQGGKFLSRESGTALLWGQETLESGEIWRRILVFRAFSDKLAGCRRVSEKQTTILGKWISHNVVKGEKST